MDCTAGRSCPNGGVYDVSRFGCAIVEPPLAEWEVTCDESAPSCYNPTKNELQLMEVPTGKINKATVIRVGKSCGECTTECGQTAGAPPTGEGGEVLAVSLVE